MENTPTFNNHHSSFSLFELVNDYQKAYEDLINDEELSDEIIKDTLESLKGDIKNKLIQISMFFKNIECFTEGLKKTEIEIKKRIKKLENKQNKIKEYLKESMEKCGISIINDSPYVQLKIQNCPQSVEINNEQILPEEYLRKKLFIEPDKILILKALKNGEDVQGASLVTKKTILIK